MNLTFEQAVVFLPLLTALITFFLTSLFTLYKDKKTNNHSKRIFFEYAEYELEYPFADAKYGEGKMLVSTNGQKLKYLAEKYDGAVYSFLVLKNVTVNNAINVKIIHSFSDRRLDSVQEIITEEFFMPIWKAKDTLYLPATINKSDSHLSTNEKLVITYNTSTFEKFRYSYIRTKKGSYKERLKKRYLGFIWIPKIFYQTSDFFTFVNVKNEETKNEVV